MKKDEMIIPEWLFKEEQTPIREQIKTFTIPNP